jgi:diguanylate cyclase (GGDEF)-like protein
MARFDNLTGLPNRSWFREKVDLKLSKQKCERNVALVVLDIDDFKHVNDTMGHVSGDKLLSAVAARLRSMSRQKLVVSRFGGDEFVLFVPDIADEADLRETMNQVLDTLSGTYVIDRHKLFINFSAGVAMSRADTAQIEDMHIQADLALYEAKRHEKENWFLFEQEMDREYSRRQRLKTDLRDAIQTQSLTLAYQPMFNPEGTRIVGAEALSRWNHPEFGPVSPAVYISLAEEMGIVGELSRSVIVQAVRTCMEWPEEMFVSVNLSAHDLGDRAIVSVISDALSESGLAPERLQVEVTEGGLMKDLATARAVLSELRKMGMTIAIDDFGTGYSSLSYLDLLPLNKVKIDRSFVSNLTEDPRKLKLLRGVVNLARELGLDIIVEGVETEAQLTLIRDNNCADLIQGYIFGAPMLSSAFEELAIRLCQSNKSMRKLSLSGRA